MSFKGGLSKSYKITVLLQLERCLLILLPYLFYCPGGKNKRLNRNEINKLVPFTSYSDITGKSSHKRSVLYLRGPERFLMSLQLLAKCKIWKI